VESAEMDDVNNTTSRLGCAEPSSSVDEGKYYFYLI
jgi:hypothetical protein